MGIIFILIALRLLYLSFLGVKFEKDGLLVVNIDNIKTYLIVITHKAAMAQLVEALRYKSEGRGFDSRWCHWNFSLT